MLGTDAAKFHELGFDVLATDFSSEFIKVVRQRYPNLNSQLLDIVKPEPLQKNLMVYMASGVSFIFQESFLVRPCEI